MKIEYGYDLRTISTLARNKIIGYEIEKCIQILFNGLDDSLKHFIGSQPDSTESIFAHDVAGDINNLSSDSLNPSSRREAFKQPISRCFSPHLKIKFFYINKFQKQAIEKLPRSAKISQEAQKRP
ncbi:MAG: hypothetical protein QME49_00490 [bacterium]|nr:hypothetical protein [bacterium]